MAAATVRVNVTEENLTHVERLTKDSCCKKYFDLETRLQEALKELSAYHLIIELLRNEVSIGAESTGKRCDSGIAKMKNIQCDPTEKLCVKTKWSDVVAGSNIGRRKEDPTSNPILESNITSPSTEKQWKTVNRGHKKTYYCKSCFALSILGNNKPV